MSSVAVQLCGEVVPKEKCQIYNQFRMVHTCHSIEDSLVKVSVHANKNESRVPASTASRVPADSLCNIIHS